MKGNSNRERLNKTIETIGRWFFVDPEEKQVGDTTYPHWNVTLLAASYMLDHNALIVGEPGFGKTTAMKVVSSMMSGYPFDLYDASQIQGHPDQTYETMLARLDFSKLKEREAVIWLSSAYLPVRNVDEVNRLPSGHQDELLHALETGRFNYLNSTFYLGKTPFFATANHPDDGNHVMIPPLRDRFAIHLELGYIGDTYDDDIKTAEDNIREALCDAELTDKIIGIINDPSLTVQERLGQIDSARQKFLGRLAGTDIGLPAYGSETKKEIAQEIGSIKVSTEAKTLRGMINSELNYTPTFGRKRSSDKVDTSNHAKLLASTKAKKAASPRAIYRGIESYAKVLAYLSGAGEVRKEHIVAVAPYALGHRLEFTEDFKSQHADDKREGQYGATSEMHLARHLVAGVEANYATVKQDLDLMITALKEPGKLTYSNKQRAYELVDNPDKLDHPLLREYARRVKKEGKLRK